MKKIKGISKFKNNKNLNATIFYGFGGIFSKAVAFITIPIFTRILSTEDYGIVNNYLAWVSIFTVIASLGMTNSIRMAFVDYLESINKYISSMFTLSVVSFFLISTFTIFISNFIELQLTKTILILAFIQAFSSFVINCMIAKYMMEYKYIKRTILMILPNFITIITAIPLILYVFKENEHLGRIIPNAMFFLLIGLILITVVMFKGKTFYNKEYWQYAINVSLPLIAYSLSEIILAQVDRIMLTEMRSASETGIYSLVYNFGMVLNLFTGVFASIWVPWFTNEMKKGSVTTINQRAKEYIFIVTGIAMSIVLVSPEVLKFMTTSEYWEGIYLIPFIVFSSLIIYYTSFYMDVEYYYKKTKVIATISALSAVVNILLNLIIIPIYGAIGAAFTTLVSYLFSLLLHYFIIRRVNSRLIGKKVFLFPMICVVITSCTYYLIIDITVLRWMLALGVCIYVFPKTIRVILK
ncbi:lipopolysaccharide biosynthesis protein [Mesobacillus harenae]|uniref:lipopolysaccharide biosynthesis protein n=1 Tax=Mesobacillus harenae TaxID=2213203 RepID=UPI00158015E4|nr:oligosaccharide flippase family protein [Mesobacillus harenae]